MPCSFGAPGSGHRPDLGRSRQLAAKFGDAAGAASSVRSLQHLPHSWLADPRVARRGCLRRVSQAPCQLSAQSADREPQRSPRLGCSIRAASTAQAAPEGKRQRSAKRGERLRLNLRSCDTAYASPPVVGPTFLGLSRAPASCPIISEPAKISPGTVPYHPNSSRVHHLAGSAIPSPCNTPPLGKTSRTLVFPCATATQRRSSGAPDESRYDAPPPSPQVAFATFVEASAEVPPCRTQSTFQDRDLSQLASKSQDGVKPPIAKAAGTSQTRDVQYIKRSHPFTPCSRLLRSNSSLKSFHSMRAQTAARSAARVEVWPMPRPFPDVLSGRARRRASLQWRSKLGVTFLVLVLNWLALGQPAAATSFICTGASLARCPRASAPSRDGLEFLPSCRCDSYAPLRSKSGSLRANHLCTDSRSHSSSPGLEELSGFSFVRQAQAGVAWKSRLRGGLAY